MSTREDVEVRVGNGRLCVQGEGIAIRGKRLEGAY